MDMRFGVWNLRRLYRAGSLTAAARETAKCKLHVVGVQDARRATGPAGNWTFLLGGRNKEHGEVQVFRA
jgi:hypothetical protein